ncbi:dTDP-4-dehydrorhamnose reductase [Seohaeicola zhoushanensis]|uniref:dTDP-4-dehydrorhamnose reductase n=1 Tax=Seohaeicola zhoushanensis TaxID=1569283 RepID=A0A8J3H1B9_9RHOB|nr:dTDP-4-dehydrorhamnose reductase [Seohaeicola zhoushanensis]GHF71849.1 NAD(P)-dependent oxidoreductase [Seohaeicola zhoushanensis]
MSLLVFGKTGQLARELARRAPEARFLGRDQADFTAPQACAAQVDGAEAVIIAAAYTAVDKAESEEALATTVNAETPGAIAAACAERGIPLVHVSTDYVFDGAGSAPWRTDDATGPLGAYGRTKLKGEQAVTAAGGAHVILRTSWVVSAHGANFVKTMLRLGAEREVLRVVADQVGGPTPTGDLAAACLAAVQGLQKGIPGGIHHFAGAPDVSWAGFAREIFAQAGLPCAVEEIATADYPTPARRPANSRLDCSGFEADFGVKRPDWRVSLAAILKELGAA